VSVLRFSLLRRPYLRLCRKEEGEVEVELLSRVGRLRERVLKGSRIEPS
jgi:hypothetical protein